MTEPIYIVDGARTPFLKSRNRPGPFAASDLATAAGRALLVRQPFAPADLDEVILGCASPSADEVNIGRVVALRMGCGQKVPGLDGDAQLRVGHAGARFGDQQHPRGPLESGARRRRRCAVARAAARLRRDGAVAVRAGTRRRRCRSARQLLAKLKLGYLAPVIGIMKGLTDPMVGLLMGQTAENLAFRFGITRREMDEFSARSHRRVLAAQQSGHFDGEIVPLYDKRGQLYAADDGVRADSTVDNLAKLRPFFDRKYGNVTAGNSSQITDGAAWLVLASERAVSRYGLTPRGRIADSEWAGLDPAQMGLGPVHAATPILRRHGLGLNDVDAWEINEAFAAQVIACERAWNDAGYCKERTRARTRRSVSSTTRSSMSTAARSRSGHPVGASGARIVLHVLNVLERTGGRRGIATICIGGGQGGAMLIERPGHHRDCRCDTGLSPATPTASRDSFSTRPDASANTLSAEVLAELNEALVGTRPRSAQGPRHRLGQGQRLHRRRRRRRIPRTCATRPARSRSSSAAGTRSSGWRRCRYPTVALVRGFCLGGGLELALACRYRVVVDEPGTRLGLPEVMLGIVPGWGGIRRLPRLIGAPAAFDLLLTGRTIDARKAKRLGIADECVPARVMENAARGVLVAKRAPRSLPFPLSLTLNPLVRPFIAAQARKAVARRARREHYPAPYAILELWVKYDGDALAAPASDPASIPSLLEDADGRQPDPRVRPAGAPEVARQGRRFQGRARARRRRRHDGRRHRGVVRAARIDRHAAGPERGADRAGDGPCRRSCSRGGRRTRAARATRPTA